MEHAALRAPLVRDGGSPPAPRLLPARRGERPQTSVGHSESTESLPGQAVTNYGFLGPAHITSGHCRTGRLPGLSRHKPVRPPACPPAWPPAEPSEPENQRRSLRHQLGAERHGDAPRVGPRGLTPCWRLHFEGVRGGVGVTRVFRTSGLALRYFLIVCRRPLSAPIAPSGPHRRPRRAPRGRPQALRLCQGRRGPSQSDAATCRRRRSAGALRAQDSAPRADSRAS